MNKHTIAYASIVLLLPCASYAVLPELMRKICPNVLSKAAARNVSTASSSSLRKLYTDRLAALERDLQHVEAAQVEHAHACDAYSISRWGKVLETSVNTFSLMHQTLLQQKIFEIKLQLENMK